VGVKQHIKWTRFVLEGLVIVASILLAFGIDAWWDGRSEAARRAELVDALIADFEVTRERLSESLATGEDYIARSREVLRLTSEASVVPKDSIQFLLGGFLNKIDFEPALSTYEAAVGSGDLAFLESEDFLRAAAEFRRARDFYEDMDQVTAELFFLGPTLELRQRLGSLGVLTRDPRPDCEGFNSCYPSSFALDAGAIQSLVLEPRVFGSLEAVQNANLNIVRQLQRMDDAAALVLEALRSTG
jgi:hypothetical protein